MRHFIPLAICALAVIGGSFLAVNVHQNYIHQLNVKNAKAALQHARVVLTVQGQAQATVKKLQVANTDIVLLIANCKEGQTAYNMLTASQKQQVHAPYCSYSQVQ
jgi:hypothetical protein